MTVKSYIGKNIARSKGVNHAIVTSALPLAIDPERFTGHYSRVHALRRLR